MEQKQTQQNKQLEPYEEVLILLEDLAQKLKFKISENEKAK